MFHDQASGLRQLFALRRAQSVAWFGAADPQGSGLLAKCAKVLASGGEKVLVVDEHSEGGCRTQLSTPNAHIRDMQALLRGEATLDSAPWRCAPHLELLSADRLGLIRNHRVQSILEQFETQYAYLLFDCAGHPESALTLHAPHWVVLARPGKKGIMQAYAGIKRLAQSGRKRQISIVVLETDPQRARQVFANLSAVAHQHIGLRLRFLGAAGPDDGTTLAGLLGGSLPHPVAPADPQLALSA